MDIPKPRIVVTIHGIRTNGKWQKTITPYLARYGLIPYHIDYGWFGLLRFLFPCTRSAMIQRVQDDLRQLISNAKVNRVSVVAHSFGTLLATEALVRDNGTLQYDRLILTGSIVHRDFDWKNIFDKRWVRVAFNERAENDWVVTLAYWASVILFFKAGDTGRIAFNKPPQNLIDRGIKGGHSNVHNPLKYDSWARILAYPRLEEDSLAKLRLELQAIRQLAAQMLDTDADNIRANFFAPLDGALRIVPGATDNMNWAPEYTLKIEPNHGATGNSFAKGNACLVVNKGTNWTGNTLPGDELEKIHPNLKWVVSLPLKSKLRDIVVGVVNVDGLNITPEIFNDETSEDCQALMLGLHSIVNERLAECLDKAFNGEKLEPVGI